MQISTTKVILKSKRLSLMLFCSSSRKAWKAENYLYFSGSFRTLYTLWIGQDFTSPINIACRVAGVSIQYPAKSLLASVEQFNKAAKLYLMLCGVS